MTARDTTQRVKTGASGSHAKSAPTPTPGDTPEELVVTAEKQLTLRCGESSITLTAAGKIIIRGKYIVSRSSGVQRIKGGSVQIN